MVRDPAGQCLPAADDRVDIKRIELQPVATPAGALGGDQRGAAAEKGVEHDLAAGRAVEDRIGNQRDRFDGRVQRQQVALVAASAEGIATRIPPHIAAVAPKAAELDIVAVLVAAMLEDKDELVLVR